MSVSWMGGTEIEMAELNPASEARLAQRVTVCCPAMLSFESKDGSSKTIKVRAVNMSASGVLVEAFKPLSVGTKVNIQANELLVGTAYVRHTGWSSRGCKIGLEFARAIPSRY